VRICVIFNPVAKGEKARRFLRHLDLVTRESTLRQTSAPESAGALAAEAVREGYDTIVAAGGDGTLNEVLNGISREAGGWERARLGVLPLGTVNVFARELGIPIGFYRAWQAIRQGRETRIDLAGVEFAGKRGKEVRYFAQMAGAGLDARAIELLDWGAKKKVGTLAYVLAGMNALRHPPTKIMVTTSDASLTGELVLIGNGRFYGGNFSVFPQANLRDGLLEVCVFPKMNWATLALCGSVLLATQKLPSRSVRRLQTESLTLSSESCTPFEVDGEWAGHLPAIFTVHRHKLRVIVP
jgi:YegS/Rv2252/BmrU family lipid kinase